MAQQTSPPQPDAGEASAPKGSSDFEKGRKAYLEGDLIGAMVPLRRAADKGDADAQALLGYILDKAEFDEEALEYLKKSAAQDNAEGNFGLAMMYLGGEGVERDPASASKLLRRAASKGHTEATRVLALAYIQKNAALGASDQNTDEAREILAASAATGYLPAMEALATGFGSGAFGFSPDETKAREWRAKIAEMRKSPAKNRR